MRVVIDTNIIASAIVFGGKPLQIINLLMQQKIEVYASPEIISEYEEIIDELMQKYPGRSPKMSLTWILANMNLIQTTSDIQICRDPDDNKFLNCAIDAACLYITTGDKDLLTLHNYNGIKICTVSEFLSDYETQN